MAVDVRFPVMGTLAHVVVTADPSLEDRLTEFAARELSLMERRWSRFLPTSELSRLNGAAGKPVIVSADTFSVIKSAVDAWEHTDGLFDPTIHDALCATGYDRTFAEAVARNDHPGTAAPTPGCSGIEFDPSLCAVRLPKGVHLDLGGIGKGAAAISWSVVARGRRRRRVRQRRRDIRVEGRPPTNAGWVIELAFGQEHHRRVALSAGAVCTSTRTKRRWMTTMVNATTSSTLAEAARPPGFAGSV
jgi:thiamine biosynthesis lipoprotein